ncbi:hypothetical protein T484DRAFT_1743429 [Baffinella frigidus]|nr:hypothetical protein T484DRAFT_1743429 [Cryptophyta sp. CCMP2293]
MESIVMGEGHGVPSIVTAVTVEDPYGVREGWGHASVTANLLSDPDFTLGTFCVQDECDVVVPAASPMIMHVHASAGGDVLPLQLDVLQHDPAPVDVEGTCNPEFQAPLVFVATAVKVEDGDYLHHQNYAQAENGAQKVDRRFGHRSAEARASVSEGMRIKAMKVRPLPPLQRPLLRPARRSTWSGACARVQVGGARVSLGDRLAVAMRLEKKEITTKEAQVPKLALQLPLIKRACKNPGKFVPGGPIRTPTRRAQRTSPVHTSREFASSFQQSLFL